MIYILSSVLDNQKASKNSFQATTFKVEENSRTFQGKMEFKDFPRTSPKIQGLFKTVQTLYPLDKSKLIKLLNNLLFNS